MPMYCTSLKPILFADDITLITSGQDLNVLASTVNSELFYMYKTGFEQIDWKYIPIRLIIFAILWNKKNVFYLMLHLI